MNIKVIIILVALTSVGAFGASKNCKNLHSCIELVSELTEKSYLLDSGIKETAISTKNLELTRENADRILSKILFMNGYTRIPMHEDNGYMVINARDVRYSPIPQVEASKDKKPDLPETFDYYQLVYHPLEGGPELMKDFTRSARPFMSRYGRIISMKYAAPVIIQDTASNLKRLYKMVVRMDRKLTKEEKKRRAEWRKQDYEIKKLEAKNCTSKKEVIKEIVRHNKT